MDKDELAMNSFTGYFHFLALELFWPFLNCLRKAKIGKSLNMYPGNYNLEKANNVVEFSLTDWNAFY